MSETTERRRRVWINPRVVVTVIGLLVVIAASVVVTDVVSIRDKNPAPAASAPAM